MYLYHLSHTDLDGYACQWVAKHFIKDIYYYNTNYGNVIITHIDNIFAHIATTKSPQDKIMVLITDVNLTLNQCQYINDKIEQSHCLIDIQLLDHHITGLEASECYDWYYLQEHKCATLLCYEYFTEHFKLLDNSANILPLVKVVNSVDMWLDKEDNFEFGKVCMQLISKANELPKELFKLQEIAYKHHLLDQAMTYIDKANAPIALDEDIYFIKKRYLNTTEVNDTFDNIIAHHIVYLLEQEQERLTITYQDSKALLTFGLFNISILANLFLKKHPEIDFFINVSNKGHISMRSNDKVDVAQVAKLYFGGGGHKNASGGMIDKYKPCLDYSQVKEQVMQCLQQP